MIELDYMTERKKHKNLYQVLCQYPKQNDQLETKDIHPEIYLIQ